MSGRPHAAIAAKRAGRPSTKTASAAGIGRREVRGTALDDVGDPGRETRAAPVGQADRGAGRRPGRSTPPGAATSIETISSSSGSAASYWSSPGMSASRTRWPSWPSRRGTASPWSRRSIAPSCAKNGGTAFSHADAPSASGSRQMLDRFQLRICSAGPTRSIPRASSTSSAHRRSASGPPGIAHGRRSGWSSSSTSNGSSASAARGDRPIGPATSARYVTPPPCGPRQLRSRASAARRRRGRSASRTADTTAVMSCHQRIPTATSGSRPIGVPSGVTSSSDARRGGGSGSGFDIAVHHRARGPSRTRHNARNTSEGA